MMSNAAERVSLLLCSVEEMIANPFETRSDSFYFVNNKLIMHHKAEYSFAPQRETDTSRE